MYKVENATVARSPYVSCIRLAWMIGFSLPVFLWFLLRSIILGIDPMTIKFPFQETSDQRLFCYVIFGIGMLIAALLARGLRSIYVAPATGFLSYTVLMSYIQGLFTNPDLWKFWERGYLARSLELVLIGFVIGTLMVIPRK